SPVETLEHTAGDLGRQPGTAVGHREHHVLSLRPHGDPDGGALGGVHTAVVEQVVYDLAEPAFVSLQPGRAVRLELDRTIRIDGAGALHRFFDDPGEVHRLPLQGPALVEAGQQEQVVDQDSHPGCLRLDP